MRTPMTTAGGPSRGAERTIVRRLLDEMRRLPVIFLYLWVIFGLFVLNERIILQQRGIDFRSQGFALINALVLAKVMLIAEDLHLGQSMHNRPLIVPIILDSVLFGALFIVAHLIEEVVVGLIHGQTIAASVPVPGGGGFDGLVCVIMLLVISLIPYFACKHLSRAVGPDKLRAMLFRTGIEDS